MSAQFETRLSVVAPAHDTAVPVPAPATGQPQLAAKLFEQHAAYVARVALRILGRDTEVDDVVQDVFSVVIRKADQVPGLSSPRQWLAGITVRRARQVLRWRRVRRLVSPLTAHDYDSIADPGATPAQRTLVAEINRALDELPADVRIAWVLRYIEQESLEDAARICLCSLATVKRRIEIAQRQLHKVMSDA